MATSLNRRWFTVASAPGTGDVAAGSALAGYLGLGAAQDGMTFDGVTFLDGSAWEVRNGCTYGHGTTTLSRGTLEESSTGSAISLSSATTVMLSVSADAIRRFESAALATVAGPNSNTTMEVGKLYLIDGSALTGDRTYTLPAVAAVDDKVAVKMGGGSVSYEVLLTAASGDTLEGIAGGTEWSRVFIAGESVVFRCTVANSKWVVDVGGDGRIACKSTIKLSADADGEVAATFYLPTSLGGAWTADHDVGEVSSTSTGRFTIRRPGRYNVFFNARSKDGLADGKYLQLQLLLNGATSLYEPSATSPATQVLAVTGAMLGQTLAAGDYLQLRYRSEDGGVGLRGAGALTQFALQEIL